MLYAAACDRGCGSGRISIWGVFAFGAIENLLHSEYPGVFLFSASAK